MAERTIFRPRPNNETVRALVRLPETLTPGRTIRVRGFIPATATRFAINLQNGDQLYVNDVILHLSVRFDENAAIRNHFLRRRGWIGPEEVDGGMPFRRDSRYEVLFTIELNSIRITVNGAHFVNFNHRLPFVNIDHVTVVRDCDVRLISFEEAF